MSTTLAGRKARAAGFTLIELMVSLTLLVTLAAAMLPLSENTSRRQRELELRGALREIRGALDAYHRASDEGRIEKNVADSGYPATLSALISGITDKKSPTGKKIYFLRRVPRDPMCGCPDVEADKTWRLRSYDSSYDSPAAGRNVYDVFSSSPEPGLNGIPYEKW